MNILEYLPWPRRNTQVPQYRILLGTHHKTGSHWMRDLFKAIAQEYDLIYYGGSQDQLPDDYDIFFQDHSQFDFKRLKGKWRGLHLIRDPRDIIISGAFFHQHSHETWLHQPMPILDGLSYQEAINRKESLAEKIRFEMEYAGRHTVMEMLAWNDRNPRFIEIKYEDLITDNELRLFQSIFSFLGFPQDRMPRLLEIAHAHSLFSGQVPDSRHIRSGQPRQWERYFDETHHRRFRELFGDVLLRLGYERR